MVGPLRTYLDQRERLARLERQTQVLQQANAGLEAQIRRLNDPEYLERLARERLGMVRPGEIGFVPVPAPRASRSPGT
jgi:cell division protein FtsB